MMCGNRANMEQCLQVGEENPRQLLSFFFQDDPAISLLYIKHQKKKKRYGYGQ